MPGWKRRSSAFLIDFVLLSLLWGIIDQSIIAPGPEVVMSAAKVVVFCLYFALTEGLGGTRASPGKRLLGLAVVLRDGQTASTQVILGRAAILSLILVTDWVRVIWALDGELPLVAYALPEMIVAGLVAYNAWLGFRGHERLMLQDGLTGSQVVLTPVPVVTEETGPTPSAVRREWPSPALCLGLVAVFIAGGLAFTAAMGMRPLDRSHRYSLAFELEKTISSMADVRTRVDVTENLEVIGETRNRYLAISIWLPYRAWNPETLENIEVPYAAIAARAEDFDSMLLKPWTGIGTDYFDLTLSGETWVDLRSSAVQFNLGILYNNGQGVPQDYVEARKWFLKAAEQRHALAQFNLGVLYDFGQGGLQDYAEARKWYLKAAEQGDADAQYNLGVLYNNGQGVSQDYVEARKWYLKAAEQGHALAQYNFGVLYDTGQGGLQDYAEARKWYLKAADQGLASAQNNLGIMYDNGKGVALDDAEAAVWFRKAAEQGDADAQYGLGFAYLRGTGVEQNSAEAAHWWRAAAEQGDADAQYAYGYLYSRGEGVSLNLDNAVIWYQKAATQGYSWAEYALGSHYALALGVEWDPAQAAKWFQLVAREDNYAAAAESFARQAEKGEDDAQFFLGMMYQHGHGVPQDDAKALEWFQKAADQGYVVARIRLDQMNQSGQGVARDIDEP